ncbi:hypothetical protein TRIATDRAFT_93305 [Trichoderma atroviride IMI 206040]|uniref:Uncharacterized protein n=1 Tax=Hypocrea atroviridis (strain ATCC 20476 / IMI 206040) TaxID=452589 RepID=G9NPA5_HYPAI|nr:uncharacterized protein TRIATDRAFT_93305 [Trichoderma atroviride IMI 206040]EHK47377.1 hypothetical protein TRIATDRAFT_93305 [Trichoderma atroviride IMI 206040]
MELPNMEHGMRPLSPRCCVVVAGSISSTSHHWDLHFYTSRLSVTSSVLKKCFTKSKCQNIQIQAELHYGDILECDQQDVPVAIVIGTWRLCLNDPSALRRLPAAAGNSQLSFAVLVDGDARSSIGVPVESSTFFSKPPHDPAYHLVSTAVSHWYLQADTFSMSRQVGETKEWR